MTQSVNVSVDLFPPGGAHPLRLVSGVFNSPEELVHQILKVVRNLQSTTFIDGRIMIDWLVKPTTASKENLGISIHRDESMYDALHREAERFFDVDN